jgi:hypothetical protein
MDKYWEFNFVGLLRLPEQTIVFLMKVFEHGIISSTKYKQTTAGQEHH